MINANANRPRKMNRSFRKPTMTAPSVRNGMMSQKVLQNPVTVNAVAIPSIVSIMS